MVCMGTSAACMHTHPDSVLNQCYGPSLCPHLVPFVMPKITLYLPCVPESACVSIVGLCWQNGSTSFSGKNILDCPCQDLDGNNLFCLVAPRVSEYLLFCMIVIC